MLYRTTLSSDMQDKNKTALNIFIDCNRYEHESIKRPKRSGGGPETFIMDGL